MDAWLYYIKEGWFHIADWTAYDHIFFIIALAISVSLNRWRVLLAFVTVFTIGHSIALALATFDIVRIESSWVEFLIPLTIIWTAAHTIYKRCIAEYRLGEEISHTQEIIIVLLFGIIHGLGFSNYLRFMITRSESITETLLLFNVGLEIGQIMILVLVLILNFIAIKVVKIYESVWFVLIAILLILFTLPIVWQTGKILFNI